jgi:hypothetical protein
MGVIKAVLYSKQLFWLKEGCFTEPDKSQGHRAKIQKKLKIISIIKSIQY